MEGVNDQNLEFYNNIDIDPFKLLAQVGGFNTFNDLELAFPHIVKSDSILEIGAGYGRCLDFLIRKKYPGKIIAVEQSEKLAAYLSLHYKHRAEIIHENIKALHLSVKVDAALWMWSGLIDFSAEEQLQSIKNISAVLNAGGKLVIDLPRSGVQTIAQHHDKKNISFESPYGTLMCYIPDAEDISRYAEAADFKKVLQQDYCTSTDKQRTLFILEK
jgi:hypothetical protein